jgi:hypothetical protein
MDQKVSATLAKVARWQAEKEVAPIATRDALYDLNAIVDELNRNTERLNDHVIQVATTTGELHEAMTAFHRSSDRSARVMIWMTAAILLLTAAVVALAIVSA